MNGGVQPTCETWVCARMSRSAFDVFGGDARRHKGTTILSGPVLSCASSDKSEPRT